MKFKDFIEAYDDWEDAININNNDLERIISCCNVAELTFHDGILFNEYKNLIDKEVISFGFWEGELYVRLDV